MASEPSISIDELAERRGEMDVTLSDVGEQLARSEAFELAGSTLSSRVGEWERGDREFDPEDLEAYGGALEAIHAERNPDYPLCTRCECEPTFEPDEIDGKPFCLVCAETIKRDRKRERMARIRAVLDDVGEDESEPVDEHRPLTAFADGGGR